MAEFLTIGEPMAVMASRDPDVSLVDAENFKKFVAGAELNVALGISRLGHSAAYVSSVGTDPLGQFIKRSMVQANIDTNYLLTDSNFWTGFYFKQKVTHGDPSTFYFRKNSAAANLDPGILDKIDFSQLKIAHLSGIFAALSANDLQILQNLTHSLLEHHITTTFDPNLRPALWPNKAEMVRVTNELAKNAGIVMPGINEGKILMGSRDPETIADFYLNQSNVPQAVVIKLGPAGAMIKQRNGQIHYVPGFKVSQVIDTVGAGDGFAVGLISALLDGKSLPEAAKRACAVGALAVMSPGDNDGYPTPSELKEFYASQSTEEGTPS